MDFSLTKEQAMLKDAARRMKVMGAFGYIKEFRIERIFRDMKLSELYEGVNEIQRVISASDLLR